MRNHMVDAICDEAKINKNIFFVTGDLGFNVLNKFFDNYPDRYINAGISEQNMTSVAAGLALSGKCVFTYSIGTFSTIRCLEQIRNDICYHNANVKVIALAAGFAYGSLGMSHHSTEDIACMSVMPNMTVFSPCDPLETIAVTKAAMKIDGPCYIRLGRGGEPNLWDKFDDFEVGKAYKMYDGDDTVILSTGSITIEALKAIKKLREEGIKVGLYTFPTIKPLDLETIKYCSNRYKRIITLEEHQKNGGFGSIIADAIACNGLSTKLVKIGLNDEFTSVVGDTNYLRKYYKLDEESIIKIVKQGE